MNGRRQKRREGHKLMGAEPLESCFGERNGFPQRFALFI